MNVLDHIKQCTDIKDPENYLVVNFASDSIKKDAKILQASYVHKGDVVMFYVEGGDPRLNDEFTKISARIYENEALSPEDVENELVEYLQDEEIEYIVYNNDMWNRRLIENNEWIRLGQMMNRLPCFALSGYEIARRAFGDTLYDFGSADKPIYFKDVCSSINSRAKTAPKGNGCNIYTNYRDRSISETIPIFTTESEKMAYAMHKVMVNILENGMNAETYRP